ncbi:MAG: hypothetical protein ACYSTT_24605 [Planctomycetota bacterium]|jgi:hypothetical protein
MRRIRERIIRFAAARLATVFFVVAIVIISSRPAMTTEQSSDKTKTEQAKSADKPFIEFGLLAPDFELPKLTLSTDAAGKSVGRISEKDKVKLSDFRGKKPVCLIMSSYT